MRRLFQFATADHARTAAEAGLAVYVYGIARRDGMVESAAPFIEGIVPGVPVEIIPAGGYAVIVSRAPLQLLVSASGELSCADNHAMAHHRALINLAMFSEVAPVQAGFILQDADAIFDWLARAGGTVSRALDRVGRAQEWGVRLFADMENCARTPVTSPAIAALEAGMQGASPAKALSIRKKLLDERSREVLRNLTIRAESVHRRLLDMAREGTANPLTLGAAWNGVAPILLLDSAYLVARGHETTFHRYAEELTNVLYAEGFSLELSGPWPPYSFSAIDVTPSESIRF